MDYGYIRDRIGFLDRKLTRYGVRYMFPHITVLWYIAVKAACMAVMCLIYAVTGLPAIIIIPCAVLGYYFPDILVHMSNSADNDAMMPDIESIYDVMRIQARAGVFLKDSLMDCYINTANKRLKAALLELCNQMSTNMTVQEAIDNFSEKFCNRHIDILCIVLSQSQSSGKTVQILSDMSGQINQLRHSRAKCDEGKLERKIEVIELLIFVGILAIGVYAMGSEIIGMTQF